MKSYNSVDVGKLPNNINIVLCDCFIWRIFFSIFVSHRSGDFIIIPFNNFQSNRILNLLLPSYVTKIFVLTGYYSGPMSFEWGIKILTIDREVKTNQIKTWLLRICDIAIGIWQLKISSLKKFRYYFVIVQALGLFCRYYNWNTRRWALNNKLQLC